MKIEDLAELLGKSASEIKGMLKRESVIQIDLADKESRQQDDDFNIRVI